VDLISFQCAYRWGMKAAEDGLTAVDNPYRSEASRAAWRKGYSVRAMSLPQQARSPSSE
jgi:hypothetical protein